MPAVNTPLYDLIELSSVGSFRTYDSSPSGGGQILGVVDNATYTDGDGSNSATQIAELNESGSANGGTLTISGVDYDFTLAVPDSPSDFVTVTVGPPPGTATNIGGDGGSSDIVFIQATPVGGGAGRYFVVIDDDLGDFSNILSIQTRSLDFSPAGDDVMIDLDQNNAIGVVCFAAGTRIATPKGPVPVEQLRRGQRVTTWEGAPKPLLWVGQRRVRFRGPEDPRRPIVIPAGALGPGLPSRALQVSPHHRLMITSPILKRMFGPPEALVAARSLVATRGIHRDTLCQCAHYVHLLCRDHHIVLAEGAPAETLLLGDTATAMLTARQRLAVQATGSRAFLPARPILDQPKRLATLLARHSKHDKPLVPGADFTARPKLRPLHQI